MAVRHNKVAAAQHADNVEPQSAPAHFDGAQITALDDRALTYVEAGLPLHLCGPAGTGKTTTALRVAERLGRPIIVVSGNSQLTTADLLGRETGTRSKRVVDAYIQSVRKTQSETSLVWADGKLSEAMRYGYTFVYDEFSRTPAATNNVLLMPLEERRLIFTHPDSSVSDLKAHEDFRAIFTSNPSDYSGVGAVQDALLDRMITVRMGGHDIQTTVGIVAVRTGLDVDRASQIVGIVNMLRSQALIASDASVRSCIMLATIVKTRDLQVDADNPGFVQLCVDIFLSKTDGDLQDGAWVADFIDAVRAVIRTHCIGRLTKPKGDGGSDAIKSGTIEPGATKPAKTKEGQIKKGKAA
ncbi:MAG: AAA family ATPase [Pseudomonadota bacterium]